MTGTDEEEHLMRSRTLLVALAAITALVLAGCGGDDAVTDDGAAAGDGATEFDISMQDMEFVPDAIEVPAGEPVTFNVTNDGALEHDLMFEDGSDSGVVQPGESATFTTTFDEDTTGWCDVPGHRESGMELDVTVTN
jgi:nitrite reductase (NO-forming)